MKDDNALFENISMFDSPTTINLEITELCNVKCSHCYNFWRDESMGSVEMDVDKIDLIIQKIVEAKVFHVILTGGEPMANFDVLEHALTRLRDANISTSCNSNLMLATPEKIARLRAAGLDHILTSLPSIDPLTNDKIMNHVGAYEKIINGIKLTIAGGLRVSVNMVITAETWSQVHETGRIVSGLGCQKLFVTRAVPPTYAVSEDQSLYDLSPEQVKSALDEAVRARDDFGLMIGSLVSYPLCFLGDLDRYRDFVGRGCPSQSGHRMSINSNGDSHPCVHEEERYGNVLEQSITEIYQGKMRKWHNGSFINDGCTGCDYILTCRSGCSMMSVGMTGAHEDKDPLFVGPKGITHHFETISNDEILAEIENGIEFFVPERLRFRDESDAVLVSVRWANIVKLDFETANFLRTRQDQNTSFTLSDFGDDKAASLAELFFKDIVECPTFAHQDSRKFLGLSADLSSMPKSHTL